MKYYIYFLTFIYLKVHVISEPQQDVDRFDNLRNKLQELKQRQIKEVVTPNFRSKFVSFYQQPLPWKFATGINIFNQKYMMLDNEFNAFVKMDKLNLSSVTTAIEIDKSDRISITKLEEFGNIAIMMFVLNRKEVVITKFKLLPSGSFHFQDVQKIEHVAISDALMFRIKNKLYMIIANDKGSNIALVSLYEWKGGSFYEKSVVPTQGVPQIEVFEEDGRAIIMMLRRRKGPTTICDIYEYEDQKMIKLQEIKLEGPRHIVPYKIDNQYFVLVLSAWKRHLYSWTGEKMRKLSTESTNNNDYQKITISKMKNTTLLFASKNHRVDIFMLSTHGAILITTQEYLHKFNGILSLDHFRLNKTDYIFVVGNVQIAGTVEYYKIELKGIPKPAPEAPKADPLAICLGFLQGELEVDTTNATSQNKSVPAPRVSSASMASYSRVSENTDLRTQWIEEKIKDVDERFARTEKTIESFKENIDVMEINGAIVVQGTVTGKELLAETINLQKMNNKSWTPNQWLSYSKNQTIAGGKYAKNLIIKELITTSEIDLLRDLLLNNSDVRVGGGYTIDNVETNGLSVFEINNIKIEDIFMRGRDNIVKGIKTVTNLTAGSIEALSIGDPVRSKPGINFASHVFIDDLEVNFVDGVEWKKFSDSVFRYGISKEISGNISIKNFRAKNVYAKRVNGIETQNFLTRRTDQTVNSFLEIPQINLKANMAVNRINSIRPDNIIKVNAPIFKGPVSIENVTILGTLFLNYKEEQEIVGTKESDLVQNYHDIIRIDGNLRLKNFRNLDSLKILLDDEEESFNPYFVNKYWMKDVNQVIPVHVEIKEGVRTPHLETKSLNQIGFSSFLLNNSVQSLPADFLFQNVTFLGNVHLNTEKNHFPDLERIKSEAISLNGTFYIKGKKIFKDSLKINSLIFNELNGINRRNLVRKNEPVIFTGRKDFENLVINGNLNSNSISFEELNDVNLEKLKKEAIYIDRPQKVENLRFNSISADNINVESLNGRPINEYSTEGNMFDMDVIDSLIINGKLAIGNLLGLSKINDKQPDVLFANRLKLDDKGVLHGNVKFLDSVTIDTLSATFINNINFPDLINRILYKNGNQTIVARYTFDNLKTGNLLAPKINEHHIDPLVDIKSSEVQKIIAYKGADFKKSAITNLYAENISPCNIAKAFDAINNPPTQLWSKMTVHGNVTILDEENSLYDIFENAVLLNEKNIIYAPVNFKHISTKNVLSNEYINSVNLTHIFSDALMKKSKTEQIVTGLKVIERLSLYSATVYNNSDITVVNRVDFPDIYDRIIPKEAINMMPITGKKTFFAGLQTKKLQSEKVSNMKPELLVSMDEKSRNITSAIFESTDLKSLSVDHINGQDFHHFMNERVLLDGPPIQELQGYYSFYDVHIGRNIEVPEINGVNIHDIVVDVHNQTLDSKKTFMSDLYVYGNVNIDKLNNHFMSEIYQKALLKNVESFINPNVKIMKPSIVNGTIITDSINGVPLAKIKKILNLEKEQNVEKEVNAMVYSMEETTYKSYRLLERMSSEVMYIEKSNVLQLSLDNTHDAQVFRLRDYVLIHVIGELDGSLCEMPEGCKCPVQYTIQISPENSITSFFSKGSQRVYSYDDKIMTVHLITNSVSTDATCRRNSTQNEKSTLAWSTARDNNTSTNMFSEILKFTGYVSAVEFFMSNGVTYAIVGKYYDTETNSYDLDCTVYRFNEDRTTVTEIQRIETHGVWHLKIFYTPQGINLIIGMLGDRLPIHNYEKTLFMRFNQDLEKFDLIREVQAYGCSSSVGILLESENFIALTHKHYPVLIFKYDNLKDNYVFYQNLWDPSPIGGISLFYSGHYGRSDPYLCVTSKKGLYSIYTYEYIEGWQRKFFNEIEGLRNLVPFELNDKLYLLALSTNVSSVLTVVKYGAD